MVIWTDDFNTIIPLAREFEDKLIKLVWKNRLAFSAPNSAPQSPATTSAVELNEKAGPGTPEPIGRDTPPTKSKGSFGWKLFSRAPAVPKDQDPEKGVPEDTPRRMRMFAPLYNGLGCALSICRLFPQFSFILWAHLFLVFIGIGISIMLQELALDPTYNRLGLLIVVPFLACISVVSALPSTFITLLSFQ